MRWGRPAGRRWRAGVPRQALLAALPATAAALAALTLVSATSSASPPQREYTLSAQAECVAAPGILNIRGEGAISFHAKAPESLVPSEEASLEEAQATITLPEGIVSFARAFGAKQMTGAVEALPLDLTGFTLPGLNGSAPEGFPAGLPYSGSVPATGTASLTIPETGTTALGPLSTSGKAGEEASFSLDTRAAYEPEQEGYRGTGKGLVLSFEGRDAEGRHALGPLEVLCTQKPASFAIPIKAPPAGTEAPADTVAPAISGEADEGKQLTATEGSWSGSAPIAYAWRWQRCNEQGEACSFIEGARGSTYAPTNEDAGHTLRAVVSASNEAGTASATSAASAKVQAAPPKSVAGPVVTGEARQGQTLTATEGTWEGAPPISTSLRWQRCEGETCKPIAAATTASYTPTRLDVGKTLRVQVSAKNAAGTTTAGSASTQPVAAIQPGSGEKEYAVEGSAQCLAAPEILNVQGEGHITMDAFGPEALTPAQEASLRAATAEVTIGGGLVRFLWNLGVREVRGDLTSFPLDLARLEPPTFNPATSEGHSEGRAYVSLIEGETVPLVVYVPQAGTFAVGPEKVTGAAGESARVSVDPSPAYEATAEEGAYRTTGKGVVMSLEGYTAAGRHAVGPIQLVCTAGSNGVSVPIGPPPVVTSISPNNGPAAGGTPVTIDGSGFTASSVVRFGSAQATSVELKSETSLKAISPAGTGTVDVTVVNGGLASTSTPYDQFAYDPAPGGSPWLGLNGNNSTYLGPVAYFAERGIPYDRSGPVEFTAGETLEANGKPTKSAEALNADFSHGMRPVITIEYEGYNGDFKSDPSFPTEANGSLARYVEGFVTTATAIRNAHPNEPILFEAMNEPWGYTTPQYEGAEYADVIARLLPAAREAGIPLEQIYVGGIGADQRYVTNERGECVRNGAGECEPNGWVKAGYRRCMLHSQSCVQKSRGGTSTRMARRAGRTTAG
jgi:hypothetical protein